MWKIRGSTGNVCVNVDSQSQYMDILCCQFQSWWKRLLIYDQLSIINFLSSTLCRVDSKEILINFDGYSLSTKVPILFSQRQYTTSNSLVYLAEKYLKWIYCTRKSNKQITILFWMSYHSPIEEYRKPFLLHSTYHRY